MTPYDLEHEGEGNYQGGISLRGPNGHIDGSWSVQSRYGQVEVTAQVISPTGSATMTIQPDPEQAIEMGYAIVRAGQIAREVQARPLDFSAPH